MDELTVSLRGAVLQDVTLTLIIVAIVVEVLWVINSPKKHLYAVPMLVLMVHMLLYYVWLTLFKIGAIEVDHASLVFTDWSAILRFHSIVTWLLLESSRLYTVMQRRANGQHH